ncbi:MAG: GNAT family N-acetyltransferase [Acidimicrobiia bacterium]
MHPRIELLRADSALVDVVVGWHWREWNHEYDNANLDEWRRRVRGRTQHDRVPFTLVAHLDDEPVGCLSVCDDDLDGRYSDRGPWLSGMVVIGTARNLGVGRALVRAVEVRARTFGLAELWLRTGEAGPFYERCGWTYVLRKEHLRDDAVMRRDLLP